jgi:hypothetical protein
MRSPKRGVGQADHDRVADVGVGLQRLLDLFGEDLLAAGVDAASRGPAASACRRPRPRPSRRARPAAPSMIGRSAPTSPGPCSSRRGRAGHRDQAALAGARSHAPAVLGEHRAVRAEREGRPRPFRAGAHHRLAHAHRLGRAEAVDHLAPGKWLSSAALVLRPHIAPDEVMALMRDRSQRPGMGVQRLQHRQGEGLAGDDVIRVAPSRSASSHSSLGVEPPAGKRTTRRRRSGAEARRSGRCRASAGTGSMIDPQDGQRRRRAVRPRSRSGRGSRPSAGLPPAPRANRSSWRHITPLGMPVVPPV